MSKPVKHEKMTEWYNPKQLLKTGIKTAISTIIGENADPRLVAASSKSDKFFDFSKRLVKENYDYEPFGAEKKEIWIDYVSDVGDGWNPTYSVAYSLAKEELEVGGIVEKLPRGEILIFGGDGVYPTATTEEYEKKLVKPYRMAFNASRHGEIPKIKETESIVLETDGQPKEFANLKTKPHVFALPGNHDWYDSLVSFQKIFCTHLFNGRTFAGGWRTRQKRSYFALKLPQKWWLLGIDLQLSHNIDVPQLEYFEKVLQQMEEGDKVVLCVPEPYWVKAIKYQDLPEAYEKFAEKEESIEKLEKILEDKKVKLKLYLAGDLHHYRRFEAGEGAEKVHKITAGGGGAFLHPTHDFDFRKNNPRGKAKADKFKLKKQYPSYKQSKKLDWQNLLCFIPNNRWFGVVPALLYPLLALLLHGKVEGEFTWTKPIQVTIVRLVEEPISLLIVTLVIAGLIFFTDSNSKTQKYFGGGLHGVVHLAFILGLGWLGYFLMTLILPNHSIEGFYIWHEAVVNLVLFLCVLSVCAFGGYFIGSFIMGAYLFISLRRGRHDNEAFSALHVEDYKNFLRMHIDTDGSLTIYPLKIETVSREWNPVEKNGEIVSFEPKNKIKPELIEKIEPI
ncbi:MAG TPA: metallophosphoesterase [Pyrinomonadaceae bacterium]|nr:metallophosphoesterase [Pyrinomonadaceae bacterium]